MAQQNHYDFFRRVGNDLMIWPAEGEHQEAFIQRVILSAVSKWMLTSLYAGQGKTSVRSVRSRAEKKTFSFLEMAGLLSAVTAENIVEYIYDVLLQNGMFYHIRDNVLPVTNQAIGLDNAAVIRGLLPDEKAFFSGCAPCTVGKYENDIAEEFDLWNTGGSKTIELVWERSERTTGEIAISEWLNLERKGNETYYLERRRDTNSITIGRNRKSQIPKDYDYYIIRNRETRRIPEDVREYALHEYLRTAIMNAYRRQRISFHSYTGKLDIDIGYLPPRSEVRFLKLFAWPSGLTRLNNPFKVSIHPDLFPLLESRFRFLGYTVEEE